MISAKGSVLNDEKALHLSLQNAQRLFGAFRKLTTLVAIVSLPIIACTKLGGTDPDESNHLNGRDSVLDFGQFYFSISPEIDANTVHAYVVGIQPQLSSQHLDGTRFVIKNIPEGIHDVVITAKDSKVAMLTEQAKAIRLRKLSFKRGTQIDQGKPDLFPVGSISGKVLANGQSDHGGIKIYIPGTDISAVTDGEGFFELNFVPPGINNLVMEKEGYHPGKAEEITVNPGQNIDIGTKKIILSTGASASLMLADGDEVADTLSIPVSILATPDAMLMMLSENENFIGAAWKPIDTYTSISFDSPGTKTVFAKVADSNGLESAPFSDSVTIDLFKDGGSILIDEPTGVLAYRKVKLKIAYPKNANEMILSHSQKFENATWIPVEIAPIFTFPGEGHQKVFAKFRTVGGYESSIHSAEAEIALFPSAVVVAIEPEEEIVTDYDVQVVVTPPKSAVKMMVSHLADFGGASWINVSSITNYTFPGQGTFSIYVKFQTADNFESPIYSDSVKVDRFGDVALEFQLIASAITPPDTQLQLTGIQVPTHATEMMISRNSDFGGGVWTAANNTYTYNTTSDYSDCNLSALYLKFRDSDGTESSTVSKPAKVVCWQAISEHPTYVPLNKQLNFRVDSTRSFFWGGQGEIDPMTSDYERIGGAIYNSSSDAWFTPSLTNAPLLHEYHFGASTGTDLIVVGAYYSNGWQWLGGKYSLAGDAWQSINMASFPGLGNENYINYEWTGSKLIAYSSNLAIYDLASDTWESKSCPGGSFLGASTWTGTHFVLWGGHGSGNPADATGFRYAPDSSSCMTISTTNAPYGRYYAQAVWTGSEMLVWGGTYNNTLVLGDGARYNPSTDAWVGITTTGAPTPRSRHVAAWLGTQMIVVGGASDAGGNGATPSGGLYNPSSDTWIEIPNPPNVTSRMNGTVVNGKLLIRNGDGKSPGYIFNPY